VNPADVPLRFGYTMPDIDRIARGAVNVAFPRGLDYGDRYDAAWYGVVEHLYTAEEKPTRRDLVTAGAHAVNDLAKDYYHTWGMADRNLYGGDGTMPAFQRYWHLFRRVTPSPEDAVIDQAALRQIWPMLRPTHQKILLAMASHADQVYAAEATGKSVATFRSHLKNARREFFALWHEHETPSRVWGKDDRRHGRRTATQSLRNRRQQRDRRARQQAERHRHPSANTPASAVSGGDAA
jgi:hypothetical protein